jgi:DNA-binding transcriptional LysR family regulator
MAELRQHACIALRENAEDVTLWKMRALDADKFESTRIIPKLASNDGRVVKQWALGGLGIMMRSEWDVARELRSGRLVKILPGYALPGADIVALLDAQRQNRSARAMRFLEYLKVELAAMPWQLE